MLHSNHLSKNPYSLAVYSLPFQYSPGFSLFSHTEADVNLISWVLSASNMVSYNAFQSREDFTANK